MQLSEATNTGKKWKYSLWLFELGSSIHFKEVPCYATTHRQ